MAQHAFAELAISSGQAFRDTIGFFSNEPLIQWISGMRLMDLHTLERMIKRLRDEDGTKKERRGDVPGNSGDRAHIPKISQ